MNIPLIIALGIAAVVVILVIVIAMQPAEFTIARSINITAAPTAPFAHVNELRKWEAWSPWEKIDPSMRKTYEGPPAGTGAAYAWNGNNKVGEGRMTIVDQRPGEQVRLKLEFFKPFKAVNTAEFTFKAAANQTAVTWSMSGRRNFMMKAFGLVMNMDKMVGGQFATGLASLKSVVESGAK